MNEMSTIQISAESPSKNPDIVKVYIDGTFIDSKENEERTSHAIVVSDLIRESGMKTKLKRSIFAVLRVQRLQYVVPEHGIENGLRKTCFLEAHLLESKKELSRILMFCSFHSKVLRGVLYIIAAVHDLANQNQSLCGRKILPILSYFENSHAKAFDSVS